jgi:RNA polymerase sigma factor FliA
MAEILRKPSTLTPTPTERRELAERQTRRLRSIARSVKRQVGSLVDIRDLVGYGAEGMMEAAARYRPGGPHGFHQYMYYRVRGAMLDAARRAAAATALVEFHADPDDLIEERPTVDEDVAERQLAMVLVIHMGSLPTVERRLIELVYFEGLTLAEAGQIVGLSRSWACRLHARAIRQLRRWLAGAG